MPARLCNQLKNIIFDLDAAFEGESLVKLCTVDETVVVQPIDSSNEVIEAAERGISQTARDLARLATCCGSHMNRL